MICEEDGEHITHHTTTLPFWKAGALLMTIDDLKAAIKSLPAEDRRKLALFILELEKDQFKDNVAPQILEDLEGLSKALQETVERVKKHVRERW